PGSWLSAISAPMKYLAAEPLRDHIPIDGVPPGIEVVGPPVLILQIVSVLPHIYTEDRRQPLQVGAVLVRGADHLELAVLSHHQPGPAAAEAFDAGVVDLGFEAVEIAERRVDRLGERARRLA